MNIRIQNVIAASLLSLFAGFGTAHGQMGANNPPPPGGGQHGGYGGGMSSGREFVPPNGFVRTPGQDWPAQERRPSDEPPARNPGGDRGGEYRLALNDAVSLVQGRYNATAVKTDTVQDGGETVYRIRLLSADRSRVWTVNVDARTGRVY